jgi:predicted transcriptional regulator of viral defense system
MDKDATTLLFERIVAEYREMPGARLSTMQAARLLGLDEASCQAVLDALVERGHLARTSRGQYCSRADAEWSTRPPST